MKTTRAKYEQRISNLEDILINRNQIITNLKLTYSGQINGLNSQKSLTITSKDNSYKKIPKLLKEYPDLFRDTLERSQKESFWIKTEGKINDLLVEDGLTSQKKFSVLKNFIYKILKEKHLLSKYFQKEKLLKLKRRILNKKILNK